MGYCLLVEWEKQSQCYKWITLNKMSQFWLVRESDLTEVIEFSIKSERQQIT